MSHKWACGDHMRVFTISGFSTGRDHAAYVYIPVVSSSEESYSSIRRCVNCLPHEVTILSANSCAATIPHAEASGTDGQS